MSKKIFVGGLPYSTEENQLRELFAAHGGVDSVQIITDRMTGRSKGFGFVEMSDDDEAAKAIEALNGHELEGRSLTVNEARPRPAGGGGRGGPGGGRPHRGGGGNRGGGRGGPGGGRRQRW
jgi:RNA recognition motif-containing protein